MAFGNRNVLNLLYTQFKASFSSNKYFGYENILHCLLYPLKMVVVLVRVLSRRTEQGRGSYGRRGGERRGYQSGLRLCGPPSPTIAIY